MIYAALLARFSADKGLIPKPSKSRFYCVTGMQQRSDEAMAVFRVERNKGYTVMSNHHLRNKELSLKAKGLLSQMLSLPEDWDYTLAGLSFINREKIDAIREAVKELERAGYIVRSRERDEKGRLRGTDYVIFEQPQTPPVSDLPTLENPTLDNPTLEKPTQEKPTLENPMQLNKDIQKTDLPKKEKQERKRAAPTTATIQENTGREILKRGGSTTVSKRGNIGRRKRRRLPPHCPHHKTE